MVHFQTARLQVDGKTRLLHWAAATHQIEAVELLLSFGANIGLLDNQVIICQDD